QRVPPPRGTQKHALSRRRRGSPILLHPMDEATFHELLQRGARYNASDALFKVGQPPAFRVAGSLHYLQGERLRAEHTQALAEIVLRQSRYRGELVDLSEYDTAYDVPGV